MAPAGCRCRCCCCWGDAAAAARRALVLLLLAVLPYVPGALATEHYTPLSLLKQELQHRPQEAPAGGGCSPQSGDWGDQFSAECGGEWAAAARGRPGRRGAGGAVGAAGRAPPPHTAPRSLRRRPRRVLPPEPLPAALTLAALGGR